MKSELDPFQVLRYRDIRIVPFSDIMDNPSGGCFFRGGPVWPDWENTTWPRYNNAGFPSDIEPMTSAQDYDAMLTEGVWLGPIFPHFGHAIADAAPRFLASLRAQPKGPFLLGAKSSEPSGQPGPVYRGILDWFGVPEKRVRVITKPTHVKTLWVAPQAEQRSKVGPSDDYLLGLKQHQERRLPIDGARGRRIFVSRSRLPAKFAGESYLDEFFQAQGFEVLHPERLSIPDQLSAYLTSREIVFSEGSAMHGLQLLGRIHANVSVINRRSGSRLANHLIEPRVRSLRYYDADVINVHGCRLDGQPAPETGISFLSPGRIEQLVRELTGPSALIPFDYNEYRVRCAEDLKEWLRHERNLPRFKHENYRTALRSSMTGLPFRINVEL